MYGLFELPQLAEYSLNIFYYYRSRVFWEITGSFSLIFSLGVKTRRLNTEKVFFFNVYSSKYFSISHLNQELRGSGVKINNPLNFRTGRCLKGHIDAAIWVKSGQLRLTPVWTWSISHSQSRNTKVNLAWTWTLPRELWQNMSWNTS